MICDAHVHVGTPGNGDIPPEASPSFVANLLKTCGIGAFIFSSLDAQTGVPLKVVKRSAMETVEAFGAGAHAFLWLTGRYYDADPNLKSLDNGIWEGVKLHERETAWVKDRSKDFERILCILEERGIPIQVHGGEDIGCRPSDLLPFFLKHPGLRADLSHCRPLDDAIRALQECPWLFADTSFMPPENYATLAAAGVVEQVMFGTDFPAPLLCYEGTAEELYRNDLEGAREYGYSEAVMSGNFLRFLGKTGTDDKKEENVGIIDMIYNKLTGGASETGPSEEVRAGATRTLRLPGGAKMEMAWCPPGRFLMGSPENEKGHDDSETLHEVTLAEGFWMAKFPVTQKQWESVMGNNPSHFKGSRLPVEYVTWFDCMDFCRRTGLSLPTEEQWEYACRAGSTGPYAGSGKLDEMGWNGRDLKSTHPVGKKRPNAWGLYDMHGNVWEWCLDAWEYGKPLGKAFDPATAEPYEQCAIRGGCIWFTKPEWCRSASRGCEEPGFKEWFGEPIKPIGFRPVAKPE